MTKNCKRKFGKPGNKRTMWKSKAVRDLADEYYLEHHPMAYGCKEGKKVDFCDVLWIIENLWLDAAQYGTRPETRHIETVYCKMYYPRNWLTQRY